MSFGLTVVRATLVGYLPKGLLLLWSEQRIRIAAAIGERVREGESAKGRIDDPVGKMAAERDGETNQSRPIVTTCGSNTNTSFSP